MKKKVKRLLIACIFSLCFVTGCSVASENPSDSQDNNRPKDEEKVQYLNVTQADLISKVTGNEKYLNPDLLYDIERLEDTDKISVIFTLDANGTIDQYFDNNRGYSSIGEYASCDMAKEMTIDMLENQKDIANHLLELGYINEVKHSYTTLFNGFSAETTYGDYKQLVKLGLAKNVEISEVYSMPKTTSNENTNVVENIVDVYDTGIFNSSTVDYTGDNTAVAILDSGFDVHHSVFQTMPDSPMISIEDVNSVLNTTVASELTSGLKAEDVYVNSKIPYAYDYADKDPDVTPFTSEHGTHVAGIIGGQDDVIIGVATNTQLVLLKVFGDLVEGAKTEDILAGLEDAVILGVDAINMSLGTSCGFSTLYGDKSEDVQTNKIYDKIEKAGISLVVAASNDYSSGQGGEESNTNKTTNPDSATVGAPSTYNAALSVASISGVKSKYITTDDGYLFFFHEANSSGSEPYDFYEMLNLPENEDKVIEYVTVPGNGIQVNYSSIDVKGKVALVKRGENSFEDKARIAYENGAVACIIYNNVGGDILMSAGNDLKIPLCSISKDDGVYLASKKSGKLIFNNSNQAGPFMSDFSSWGPNPDLTLKPEITAHGGNIKSAIPGGGYDELSGTSMASPNMCGIVVLIRQYLKEKFPTYNPKEISTMTNELLMSTATIALNEKGNVYSPRKQGAGLASLKNAVTTKAYLTVDGKDRAKLELGDDPKESGVYTLKFNLNNMSNETLKYDLSNYTMTESVSTADKRFVSEKSYYLNPTSNIKVDGGTLNGTEVTVGPNGVAKIEYTITLSEEDKRYIRSNFINGMYVEGFATLDSKNADGIDLSIPYLAFFGDWTVAPMFDKTFYEVETTAHDGSLDEEDKIKADYYATTPLGTYYYNYIIPLGSYLYSMDESKYNPIPATEEHAAISYEYDTINGITCVYAGLLRNAKKMTTTIKNTVTGEVVYEHINYNQLKAHSNGGSPIPSFDMIDLNIKELGLSNNVNYTFTMTGELDYGDGGVSTNLNNSFSFSFYVDIEAPLITDAQFRAKYDKTMKKDRYYIDVFVYDNHYVQSIRPFTVLNGKVSDLSQYPTPVYGEKGSVTKVTMEVTDYMDLLQYSVDSGQYQGIPNGFGFMVDDYAMNDAYYFVNFPGTDSDKLEFVNEEGNAITTYTTKVGEEVDLAKMLVSDDKNFNKDDVYQSEYMSKLSWKSSNEKVLKVHNGKIEGISAGMAIITASNIDSSGKKNSVKLTVVVQNQEPPADSNSDASEQKIPLEDIQFTYFDTLKAYVGGPEYSEIGETGDRIFFTNSPAISCYPSEKVQFGYEIKPWNLDPSRYTLKWSSTNEAVATVTQEGIVEAKKEGNATIMLRITVDGKQSNLIASARVNVKNEFIIEGGILTGYKGLGGDVVIPDDKGIMYIGSYAFSLYTTDREIKVDEDDWDANKTAAGNDSVTSVVIPGNVMEVQKYAFFNCPNLKKVEFQKTNKGDTCKIIKEYAFYQNTSLTDINFENIQVVGASAFQGCTSLKSIDSSKLYAVGVNSFKGCTALTRIDLTSLRNAWKDAFADCSALTSIITGPFTKFSEGMFRNTALTEVTIFADRIPNATFENCKDLASVTIENDIIYVGAGAFKDCTTLSEVTIKGSCEFIYNNAFNNTGITSITLPNSPVSLEEDIFVNCSNLATVKFGAKTEIKNSLGTTFKDCVALSSFEVDAANENYKASDSLLLNKDGSKLIFAAPNHAYGEYSMPAGITSIATGAFSGVSSLTTLDLSSVTEIGADAFRACNNLAAVTFAQEEFTLGDYAFADCSNLKTFTNLKFVKKIPNYCFIGISASSIELGDDVLVEEGAFAKNENLKVVFLGKNNTLGASAFEACSALTMVNIAGDGLVVGDFAFADCIKLSTIDLTKAVGTIGKYAFYNCSSLAKADLQNIEKVDDFAFGDCVKLSIINMPKVVSIGEMAFAAVAENSSSGCAVETIVLPNTLNHLGEGAFIKCKQLTSVEIASKLDILDATFAECTALKTVTLHQGIKNINGFAFYNNASLTSINLENVESIGECAFYQCSHLATADLTKVTTIGSEAFAYCTALTNATLSQAQVLGDSAFMNCTNIEKVSMPKVETIGAQSLSLIGVTTIELPNTIAYVAPTAFYSNNKMTAFTFEGASTKTINDYAKLENGVLYTKTAKGQWVLSSYPTAKADETFEIAAETVYIELFAGAKNTHLKKIVLPDTIKMVGNMAFFGCTQLETVEFKSTTAPILESSPLGTQSDYDYAENSAVYKLLTKYFNFNGFYPYYYGHFKAMVGTSELLNIVLPANENLVGYDHIIYDLYFDLANVQRSSTVSRDTNTLNFLEKVQYVPTGTVTLQDEEAITGAKTAWNAVKQDLTQFGYTQQELDAMVKRIDDAASQIEALKSARVQKKYSVLVQDINDLGSFALSKMDTYKSLMIRYNELEKEEKKYIDSTNLDNFKKAYDELEANVTADIVEMDKVSELPSQETANRFVYVVALSQTLSVCAACILLGKHWF